MILKSKKPINVIMSEFKEEPGFDPSIEFYACENTTKTLESLLEDRVNQICEQEKIKSSYQEMLKNPDLLEDFLDEWDISYEENLYLTYKGEWGYYRYEVSSLRDWETRNTIIPKNDVEIEL